MWFIRSGRFVQVRWLLPRLLLWGLEKSCSIPREGGPVTGLKFELWVIHEYSSKALDLNLLALQHLSSAWLWSPYAKRIWNAQRPEGWSPDSEVNNVQADIPASGHKGRVGWWWVGEISETFRPTFQDNSTIQLIGTVSSQFIHTPATVDTINFGAWTWRRWKFCALPHYETRVKGLIWSLFIGLKRHTFCSNTS